MGKQTQIKANFTPIIDEVLQDVGLITAMIFGIVWRRCQGEAGACMESHENIAREAGANRRTVQRHLQKLIEHGYIVDKTPKRKNAPHRYVLTDKASMIIEVRGPAGVSESHTNPDEVRQRVAAGASESRSRCVRESHEESSEESSEESVRAAGGAGIAQMRKIYEQEIGLVTGMVNDKFREYARDKVPLFAFEYAVGEAVANGARKLSYVDKIIRRLAVEGWESVDKPSGAGNGRTPPPVKATTNAEYGLE